MMSLRYWVFAACSMAALPLGAQTRIDPRLDLLETGVERAEAIRAIKLLQQTYNFYLDAGLWNELDSLVAKNVTAEFPEPGQASGGLVSGKDALREHWMQQAHRTSPGLADGQLNTHLLLQPIINLGSDGKTGKGTWHEVAMLGEYEKSATWLGGIYENEYVWEEGAWKIARIHFSEQYRGAYEEPGQKAPANWKVPYHFEAAHLGLTIPPSALAPTQSKAAAAARLVNLTARLQRMEDETAVRNLQHSYGYYLDRKLYDDVADLFAANGTYETGRRGVYQGNANIRRALEVFFGVPKLQFGELFDHLMLSTVVTVAPDGRTANARTVELAQLGLNNSYARWELGTYENEFVKDGGVWKIQALHYYPRMITNYDKGWRHEGLPAPGPSTEFAPSRKPTVMYANYPQFSFPAFHYPNPVTGKSVKYPEGMITASHVATAKGHAPAKTLDQLEVMLKQAIGVDATENLNSSYGYYLDEGFWDEMAETFAAKDGAKEITGAGVYVGRERIRQILKLRGPAGVGRNGTSFTIHQLTQPVIHISADGMTAKARLRLFQGGGRADGSSAAWIGGTYENTASFEDGEWKFGIQDLHHHFNATYRNGWAKLAVRPAPAPGTQAKGPAAPAPNRLATQMPPDRPIRARQYTFPEIDEPAFHFKNPVTARAPAQLLP